MIFFRLVVMVLVMGLIAGCQPSEQKATVKSSEAGVSVEERLQEAYRQQTSDFMVEFGGSVAKILPDDREGLEHQRFVVRLSSGQTLLVAHNTDLAPRVSGLSVGDHVDVYGQYEWSAKGGVVHWTHHDPQGRRAGGWIRHNGRIYQ